MMDGVTLTPLRQIADARGKIMHMMRATDPHFEQFGEIYFSWINPGIIKGWHRHSVTTVNLSVPVGIAKIVTFDDREGSPTRGQSAAFELGDENYQLLSMTPELWYGFACIGDRPAMIANCASHPHDPGESEKCELDALAYDWNISDG